MNTVVLKTNNLESIFVLLTLDLGGTLNVFHKEYRMELDTNLVTGEINGVMINGNISYIEYDLTLKKIR